MVDANLPSFLPRSFLTQKEVGFRDSQSNLISLLAHEAVAKGLEGRQEKRAGGWQMRDGETDVRNRHCSERNEGRCVRGTEIMG
jgi:hypothetical protein